MRAIPHCFSPGIATRVFPLLDFAPFVLRSCEVRNLSGRLCALCWRSFFEPQLEKNVSSFLSHDPPLFTCIELQAYGYLFFSQFFPLLRFSDFHCDHPPPDDCSFLVFCESQYFSILMSGLWIHYGHDSTPSLSPLFP